MLSAGSLAPDFTLSDQHGVAQSLSSRRGLRSVLLVFFPFAFTGVCNGEMHALSDHTASWDELGTDVLAVSCDTLPALRRFSDQERLEVPLLSDFWPHGAVSSAYGVFQETIGAASRGSFVIDRDGRVRWTVSSAMPDARDVHEYLSALRELAPAAS
jgi:mycoredoxin-dependent peroxiredoxin